MKKIIKKLFMRFFVGPAIAFDESGNCIILDGSANETISSHCGAQIFYKHECWFCRTVCKFIGVYLARYFPKLDNHCLNSWNDNKAWLTKNPTVKKNGA